MSDKVHENDFCSTNLFCFEEWLQKEKRESYSIFTLRIKFKSMFAPFIFFSFIFMPGWPVLLALDCLDFGLKSGYKKKKENHILFSLLGSSLKVCLPLLSSFPLFLCLVGLCF